MGLALLGGVAATRRVDYLLFHTLAELFAVTIAFGIFMVGWNSRAFVRAGWLVVLGNAYLFVGVADLAHTLTFSGLGIIPGAEDPNWATELWLAARFLETGALLAAPFFFARPVRAERSLALFAGVTGLLAAAIVTDVFPRAFIEGVGLTRFKVLSELVVAGALAVAVWLVHRRRDLIEPRLRRLLYGSLGLTIAAEITFTLYADPTGLFNLVGHLLKIVSFYLLYQSTVVAGLRRPYAVLFRELDASARALRDANDELKAYAHTVSHDLRGPLASISNANQLLEQLVDDESARRATAIIGRSVRSASRLIADTLAFAEAGTVTYTEEVDVARVLQDILEERREALVELDARLEVGPDLGSVRAAQTHVYQVFSNLIGNSLRHARRQGLVIRVDCELQDGARLYRFCDNGPGIPEDRLDEVFRLFNRSEEGGSGIGLSTVKKIVDAYGGRVRAHAGDGACFELTLPDAASAAR